MPLDWGSFDAGGAVLDLLQLQEQFVGMLVGPAAELAAIIGQHRFDPGGVYLPIQPIVDRRSIGSKLN